MTANIILTGGNGQVGNGVAKCLSEAGFSVFRARDGQRLPNHWDDQHASLVLVIGDGIDGQLLPLCSELRAKTTAPLVVVGRTATEDEMASCLDKGADEFLVWPQSGRLMAARVQALLRRTQRQLDTQHHVVEIGHFKLDYLQRSVWLNGREVYLSSSEFSLLSCLLDCHGRAIPYARLIVAVHGSEFQPADAQSSMKVTIRRLRQKVEPFPHRPSYIHNVRGLGYAIDCCPQWRGKPTLATARVVALRSHRTVPQPNLSKAL